MIEHSLPLNLVTNLTMLINHLALKLYPKTLKETTAHDNNVRFFSKAISNSLQKQYLSDLCNGPYSVAIDAASSHGGDEYLALNARYFVKDSDYKTTTKLLALLHLKGAPTGDKIASLLSDYLFFGEEGEIRKRNMVGISSDGAKNMISSQGAGATNRISSQIPKLIITYDICHALNLVMKKCIAAFPQKYVNIISEISTAFSFSGVKIAELKEIMENKGIKPLKIPRYIPTRWTSFFECLDRILQLREFFVAYFKKNEKLPEATQSTNSQIRTKKELETETNKNVSKIPKNEYFTPKNNLMLELLKSLLLKLKDAIKFFEQDDQEIYAVISRIKSTFVLFGSISLIHPLIPNLN